MPVLYDGKKLIPAPFTSISEEMIKDGTGQIIGANYNITVIGKIIAYKGSPTSSGTWWTNSGYPADETVQQTSRLASILHKQEAIRKLFENQGKTFEIQPWDGTAPIKCNPQVLSINFPEGIWTEVSEYTINLSATQLYGYISPSGLAGDVTNVTNQWQIDLGDTPESDVSQQTFRVTHNISAQGLLQYDINGNITTQPWQRARSWVNARIGYDSSKTASSGALNVPSYTNAYNHVRSQNTDEMNGTYSVTETWILSSGSVLEDYTVNSQTSIDNGLTRVGINGNIQGLEVRDSNYNITTTKYQSASGKFPSIQSSLFTRAQNHSGLSLNTIPLVSDIAKNPVAGTISYSYEYDNRPSNLIPNTKQELITIVDNDYSDIFATLTVLGRANGNLLQSLNTKTEKSRQLTIDVVVQPSSTLSIPNLLNNPFNSGPSATTIANIVSGVTPVANYVFRQNPQVSWNPKTGQGSYNISWTYNN